MKHEIYLDNDFARLVELEARGIESVTDLEIERPDGTENIMLRNKLMQRHGIDFATLDARVLGALQAAGFWTDRDDA